MFPPMIKIVLIVQALMLLLASHSALIACRLTKSQQVLDTELMSIAEFLPNECYDFPEIVFSASDYLIDNNPVVAKALVQLTNECLTSMENAFKPLYLCGMIFTYAENFAFCFYLVYLPCVIIQKVLTVVFWVTCYGGIALIVLILLAEKLQLDPD